MEIIETVAPIAIEELKKYFADKNTKYVLNYKDSKLQGLKFLTYLSNLDIPADVSVEIYSDEHFELLKEYFHCPFIVNIDLLEKSAIHALLCYKGLEDDEKMNKFVQDNLEIVTHWSNVLDSLSLYNFYTVKLEALHNFVKGHPEATEEPLNGLNFVSVLKHEDFYQFYQAINRKELKYYPKYFNEYIFKGKNLYAYWGNENNPMFCLTYGIASGVDTKPYFEETVE